ncbi:hypothetical protein CHISP_2063 [Chitinispirillum alkaliphilum]|nr:hypothetical protein CHISP_2063 [Chitinispirillum alkaliphilum]
MSENRSVDKNLCDRFLAALTGCFSDETGKFKENAASKLLPDLKKEDLPSIRRYEQEPTGDQLDGLIRACDSFDSGWLRTGLIDEGVCERLIQSMQHNRLDPSSSAKLLFVTKEFFNLVREHKLMPSRIFINRFCESYRIPIEEILGK